MMRSLTRGALISRKWAGAPVKAPQGHSGETERCSLVQEVVQEAVKRRNLVQVCP